MINTDGRRTIASAVPRIVRGPRRPDWGEPTATPDPNAPATHGIDWPAREREMRGER